MTYQVAAKKALRRKMKHVLSSINPESKAVQSEKVTDKLLQLPAYQSARSVSLFLSMDDEVDTAGILEDLLGSDKKCFIPRYHTSGEGNKMDMVRLVDKADYMSLPLTKWNIKQPGLGEVREEALEDGGGGLDLILVPGLAFSKTGARCGRGRGYYDTYLARCHDVQTTTPPITVALAFNEQIVSEGDVPLDPHDFLLDHVLTPDSD